VEVARRVVGIFAVLLGAYVVVTFQAWGVRLIDWIGPERALGAPNVRREPDGSVLMTNPAAMLFWSVPFLVVGVVIIAMGVKALRRSRPAA
jgi:hypothetical protein